MFFSAKTVAVVAALFSGAMAQTYSECNPVLNGTKCGQNQPAFGTTYTYDFTKGKACPEFTATGSANRIKYDSEGMHMSVAAEKDSPTLTSNKYIFWGKVDVVMKAAPGQGVISSYVFESADLDEIDYEWVGAYGTQVQSNYFGKGDVSSYDRGGKHDVATPMDTFHKYSVEWTKDSITWFIDDKSVRTVTPDQVTGKWTRYPQTPMAIKIGAWDAGFPGNANGTVEWAGGNTQYKNGPFTMVVKSITICDYTKGAKAYSYGDDSGSYQSIKVNYKEVANSSSEAASSTLATSKGSSSHASTAAPAATGASNSTATATGGSGYSIPSATGTAGPTAPSPANNGAGSLKAAGSAFALIAAAAALLL